MSQMRSSRVTLNRVTTNQPEKIATEGAAQPKPAIIEGESRGRRSTDPASWSRVDTSPVSTGHADRSDFKVGRISSGSMRLR